MFARVRLGLSKAEFFALTPGLFFELRREGRDQRHELRSLVGLLQRDLINFSMCHPKEPVKLEDLVPPLEKIAAPAEKPARMTKARRENVANKIRLFFASRED